MNHRYISAGTTSRRSGDQDCYSLAGQSHARSLPESLRPLVFYDHHPLSRPLSSDHFWLPPLHHVISVDPPRLRERRLSQKLRLAPVNYTSTK